MTFLGSLSEFMNIKEIKISELHAYTNNAKTHDEKQIGMIAESIKQFGFRQPLVIDKNNEIVVGHGRYFAAKKLDLLTVPCEYANDLTDDQIKAYRLADNKLNESPWDFDLVDAELASISDEFDLDMSDFGFDVNIEIESFDELELDDESTKDNVIVSINCGSVANYESIKERLQNLCDEISGSLAVKMK